MGELRGRFWVGCWQEEGRCQRAAECCFRTALPRPPAGSHPAACTPARPRPCLHPARTLRSCILCTLPRTHAPC